MRPGDLIEVLPASPLYPTSYMSAPLGRSEGEFGVVVETEYGYVRFIRSTGGTVWVHRGSTVHHRGKQTENPPMSEEGTVRP